MDWEEKEEKWYMGGHRVAKDIWKYIPMKLAMAVEEAISDDDGYWVYLEKGWTSYDGGEDCGLIHVYTIADLKEGLKTVRKAGC